MTTHLKQQKMIGSEGSTTPATDSTPTIDKKIGANLQMLAKQVDMLANKVYAPPDMSTFTYDETSGYYYDYSTGFYYDSTSQYYFNPLTQQYMYWDQSRSTYIPVNSSATAAASVDITLVNSTTEAATAAATAADTSAPGEEKSNTKQPSKPATKTAAQIAKVILIKAKLCLLRTKHLEKLYSKIKKNKHQSLKTKKIFIIFIYNL